MATNVPFTLDHARVPAPTLWPYNLHEQNGRAAAPTTLWLILVACARRRLGNGDRIGTGEAILQAAFKRFIEQFLTLGLAVLTFVAMSAMVGRPTLVRGRVGRGPVRCIDHGRVPGLCSRKTAVARATRGRPAPFDNGRWRAAFLGRAAAGTTPVGLCYQGRGRSRGSEHEDHDLY